MDKKLTNNTNVFKFACCLFVCFLELVFIKKIQPYKVKNKMKKSKNTQEIYLKLSYNALVLNEIDES